MSVKIAFASSLDPHDRRSWSGTYYSMFHSLEKHCGEVTWIGPTKRTLLALGWIFNKVSTATLHKRYDHQHSMLLSTYYARQLGRRLRQETYDIVFAPAASTEVASLETSVPIVYAPDATYMLIMDYYEMYSNLFDWSIQEGKSLDLRTMKKARALVYPSSWGACSAVEDGGADRSIVHIVPYGANLEDIPSKEVILSKRSADRCRLLFLGVNWERKGGMIAFETLLALERLGVPCDLTVVGCVPPPGISHPRMKVHPFLDKNAAEQRGRLSEILLNSDFLLLPTRAEAFGIVFCEASAFGLPSITTNTGGVAGAVEEGKNGYLLGLDAGGKEYARRIADLYHDRASYRRLVESTRQLYDEKLNWDAWGRDMKKIFDGVLGQ